MEWQLTKGWIYKVNVEDGTRFAAMFVGENNGRLVFRSRGGITSAHYPNEITFVMPVVKQDASQ